MATRPNPFIAVPADLQPALGGEWLQIAGEGGSIHHQDVGKLGQRQLVAPLEHRQKRELRGAQPGGFQYRIIALRHRPHRLSEIGVGAGAEIQPV